MTRRGRTAAGLIAGTLLLAACGDARSADTADTAATPVATVATSAGSASTRSSTVPPTSAADTTAAPVESSTTTGAPVTAAAAPPPSTAAAETTTIAPATTASTTTMLATVLTTTLPPASTAPPAPPPVVTSATLPQPVAPPPPRAIEPHVEVGTIEIPKIGISKPLLEGISLHTLDKGPGHWPDTAMPGHPGNVVVAGHRTSKDRPFRYIDQLAPGDEVIFTTGEGRFVYTVTGTEIVPPEAMWIVGQTPEATATLFACHPVGSTKERIVVFLQLQA